MEEIKQEKVGIKEKQVEIYAMVSCWLQYSFGSVDQIWNTQDQGWWQRFSGAGSEAGSGNRELNSLMLVV